ncbi:MAG: arginine--tRNA ligase [Gammaproteobacteria bacterium TMED112]|nr:MAG: arginine--tRNA ligase [Gammaproteobacteria bacterium TMED112]|tara:strand:- start:24867 stop:26576 length:1710 start_codon:yes stop_codon:yes gene_type:complete
MILIELNQLLKEIVNKVAAENNVKLDKKLLAQVEFEISSESARGDYATSCCLKLAKQFNKKPFEIAEVIVSNFNEKKIADIKIEGPGFINVFISAEAKSALLKDIIIQGDSWGLTKDFSGKILLEFVSSNPTGPLHVGHGRGAVLGMAIANLLENIGYEVTKEYYVNDAGRQISILTSSVLLNAYVKNFEPDGTYEGEYIKELGERFKSMFGELDEKIDFGPLDEDKDIRLDTISVYFKSKFSVAWQEAKKFSVSQILSLIKEDLHKFNIVHEHWFNESSLGTVEDNKSDLSKSLIAIKDGGYTYSKDGAEWFKTTEFGDDKDRVLLRENKEPTYYLTDVGYHKNKIDRNFDSYINIFGADHHGYIPRLTAAFDVMKKEHQNLEFLLYQLVNLYEDGFKKTMSTRRGEYFSLNDLRKDLGPDVIKFFFLEKKSDHPIDFDMDLAKDESKNNPYFYAQYAYVRCCSILAKSSFNPETDIDLKEIENCYEIISKAINYPLILKEYALERSPHSLVHFIKDFSATFHSFYEQNPVLTENKITSNSRLLITSITKLILKNSFRILNVKPLEKM